MAIKRCPYCKAIIDESSGYCSNCGTQLLFPEDEFIEEEIPGEKIVEEDAEEEEKESAEPEEATEEAEVKEKEELEPPFEHAENIESDEEPILEEPGLKEEAEGEIEEAPQITPPSEEERAEEIGQLSPEGPPNTGKKFEDLEEEPTPDASSETRERFEEGEEELPPQKAFAFKTEELEEMVDPADKEKEDIERFLDSIKKEREEEAAEEEATPDFSEIKSKISDTGDELPPWAEKIKESTSDMDSFSEDEETEFEPADTDEEFTSEEEMAYEEKTPTFDSGVGIPERVSQKSLPFEEKKRKKLKRIKKKRPTTAANWLKPKAFDFLFIGAFWLIALWFASRVMEVSLFKLISVSVLPTLVFYVILLISYFFLFLYFLGETIGEHLFSEED